mgnify:CR=1 FL=1
MCGICGLIPRAEISEDEFALASQRVSRAVTFMHRRGPDGANVVAKPDYILGHARLAVIDPNAGQQPYTDVPGYVGCYNGEIYNFRELRQRLQCEHFDTDCDTEVLVRAYAEYGPDALEQFNGMFAFAIWDQKKRELLLARDRVGV